MRNLSSQKLYPPRRAVSLIPSELFLSCTQKVVQKCSEIYSYSYSYAARLGGVSFLELRKNGLKVFEKPRLLRHIYV